MGISENRGSAKNVGYKTLKCRRFPYSMSIGVTSEKRFQCLDNDVVVGNPIKIIWVYESSVIS